MPRQGCPRNDKITTLSLPLNVLISVSRPQSPAALTATRICGCNFSLIVLQFAQWASKLPMSETGRKPKTPVMSRTANKRRTEPVCNRTVAKGNCTSRQKRLQAGAVPQGVVYCYAACTPLRSATLTSTISRINRRVRSTNASLSAKQLSRRTATP